MTFVNSKLTEITTNFYFIVSEDIQERVPDVSVPGIGHSDIRGLVKQVNGPPRTLAVSLTWITDITVPTEFPRR